MLTFYLTKLFEFNPNSKNHFWNHRTPSLTLQTEPNKKDTDPFYLLDDYFLCE
jgi:hypothetical protein